MDDMQTLTTRTGMRHVPGGTFLMGSDRHCRDERPAHKVAVSDFRMDETAVTNAQFAVFVAATGPVAASRGASGVPAFLCALT